MAGEPYTLEQAETDIANLRALADRQSEVITKNDSTDSPNTPAAGIIHHSIAGSHKYASADGGTYNTGRSTIIPTATQTINSTSQAVVGANSVPMSWPVAAGKYCLHAEITYIPDFSAATADLRLTIGGGAALNLRANYWVWANGGGVVNNQVTAMDTDMVSSTMVAGTTFVFVVSAVMSLSGAATLSLVARTSVAADTYKIQGYSLASLFPVT